MRTIQVMAAVVVFGLLSIPIAGIVLKTEECRSVKEGQVWELGVPQDRNPFLESHVTTYTVLAVSNGYVKFQESWSNSLSGCPMSRIDSDRTDNFVRGLTLRSEGE